MNERPIYRPQSDDPFERTLDKVFNARKSRLKRVGFTHEEQAILIKYARELADIIWHKRNNKHGNQAKDIWAGVEGFTDYALALQLVADGLSFGRLERDPTAAKWYLNIGRGLGFRGREAAKAGMWAVDLLLHLPIFSAKLEGVGGFEVDLSNPEAREIFRDVMNYHVTRRPLLLPLKEPRIWKLGTDGKVVLDCDAFPDPPPNVICMGIGPPEFVSHHPIVMRQLVADIVAGRAQPVLDAANWIGGTACKINEPTLEFLEQEGGPPHPGPRPEAWKKYVRPVPLTSEDQPVPKKKPPTPTITHKYREYCKAYSKRYEREWMVSESRIVADWDEFYNPLKMDFRGRFNSIPQFAVQRQDAVRAQIDIKNGAEIGEDGTLWLKAHVAARAGGCPWSDIAKPDRQNFEGRLAWTEHHLDRLLWIGNRILGGGDTLGEGELPAKDERYQFARACVELAMVERIGPTFETHLPLMFDCSCSGLQHIAMMLRSMDGRYANLIPSETGEPTDLYQTVAEHVASNTDVLEGIPAVYHRSIVKQPVMTTFYGVTDYGMAEQIYDKCKELRVNVDVPFKRAIAIAKAVSIAIEDTVKCVPVLRNFLEWIAGAYEENNKIMRWPTPWLTVQSPYYGLKVETVTYPIQGKRTSANVCVGNTDDVLPGAAVQSVVANFVHSYDAALLHAVALNCKAETIPLLTIHDCYATLAPHARRLNEIVREQLVWLHTEHDWLAEALAMAKAELPQGTILPDLPRKGTLDPQLALKSFFLAS
jgi:DNA-directed RNA polymerase